MAEAREIAHEYVSCPYRDSPPVYPVHSPRCKQLTAAIIAAVEQATGWREIDEDTPRDGTEIILYAAGVGQRVGYFGSEGGDFPEGARPYGGWWSLTGEISPLFPAWGDLDEISAMHEPTHWKPVGPPPEVKP